MTSVRAIGPQDDAGLAACLLAVDPSGLGGVSLRAAYGPALENFTRTLRSLLTDGMPFRRVPLQIADSRLLGGLDLAATLQAGRPVLERGLLADADGGWIVLPMAERLPQAIAARLCAVLDSGEVVVERDGFTCRNASRIAIVALDEGAPDEHPPQALLDRLAIRLSFDGLRGDGGCNAPFTVAEIAAARSMLTAVHMPGEMPMVFCHASAAIGITSIRAPIFAMRVACAHAALAGRKHVNDEDAVVAGRLVLAPRAMVLPAPMTEQSPSSEDPDSGQDNSESNASEPQSGDDERHAAKSGELEDIVLAAVQAAIPAHLLAQLQTPVTMRKQASSGGAGAQQRSTQRGRPTGTRRGELTAGARLNVVETLRAAAPWQKLRGHRAASGRIQVRQDDFRLTNFKRRSESATIFVVDASGSSALHRLAEAKGAIELLLADCYVRRDQVALISFRGKCAELVLPPTRSLARAKRSLSSLPGGGGTPIAAALDAVGVLADGLRRKGITPMIVLLTDGRANVGRDGTAGRDRAEADALGAARHCKAVKLTSLLVDTSPAPGAAAERLAIAMGARYVPLPRADAAAISRVVRGTTPAEFAAASR